MGRTPRADRLAHLATALRRVVEAQPRPTWVGVRKALDAHGLAQGRDGELLDRLRRTEHDPLAEFRRALPPGARALLKHGQHPARHRIGDEDLLLPCDLDRQLGAATADEVLGALDVEPEVPLGRAWMQAAQARRELSALAGAPDTWHVVGGLRRTDPLTPDVALLAVVPEPSAWARRVAQGLPEETLVVAGSRSLALMAEPEPIVVHTTTPEAAPASLVWYTGPRGHIRDLQARAQQLGLTLKADALLDGEVPVALTDERALYSRLELPFVPVELRDWPGITERALSEGLPSLVEVADVKGDLHMHTVYSDGRDSVAGMVQAARTLGYQYVAITDHSPTSRASRVLTLERLAAQADEIAAVRELAPGMTILHGIECDIQEDGRLDVADAVLERLDIVLASMHESHGHAPDRLLRRYVQVMRHPLVNVVTHPANRSPGREPGYALDFDRLFEEAARTGTAVEIDGAPGHLDLDAPLAARAAAAGAVLVVDSDCHMADRLGRQMRFGIGLARKAGLTRSQVLNTRGVDAIRAFVAAKRAGQPWQPS